MWLLAFVVVVGVFIVVCWAGKRRWRMHVRVGVSVWCPCRPQNNFVLFALRHGVSEKVSFIFSRQERTDSPPTSSMCWHCSPSLAAAPLPLDNATALYTVLFGSVDVCLHQVTPFCTKQKSLGACTFCCCNVSSLVFGIHDDDHTHTSERRRRRIAILEWKKKTLDMSPSRAWLGKGRGNTHALGHNLPPPLRIPMKEALTLTGGGVYTLFLCLSHNQDDSLSLDRSLSCVRATPTLGRV